MLFVNPYKVPVRKIYTHKSTCLRVYININHKLLLSTVFSLSFKQGSKGVKGRR